MVGAWQKIVRFLAAEDGPTAVEYAVMMALILLACMSAIYLVGKNTASNYNNSATSLQKAFGG